MENPAESDQEPKLRFIIELPPHDKVLNDSIFKEIKEIFKKTGAQIEITIKPLGS